MNKAARVLTVGIAVAALALTGCAGNPADAASVGSVSVRDSTVRGVADTIVEVTGTDRGVALKQATYDLTLGEASRQIAQATGTAVSPAQGAAVISQNQAAAAVAATEKGAPWAAAVGTTYVLLQDLGEERFIEELNKLDINVNPRYGAWDPQRVTIVDSPLSSAATANA